jgi:hypothetical protein
MTFLDVFEVPEHDKAIKNINAKQDLCQDFGSSVPDSRCGRKIYVEFLNIITSFCVLKSIDINKGNK